MNNLLVKIIYKFLLINYSYYIQILEFFIYREIFMELELDLSFFYGSTILPECILIFFLLIILILDLILEIKNKNIFFFISFLGLLISVVILLFQLQEKTTISFLGNFQADSFNKIFRIFIALCSILCIPLSIDFIKCTKLSITEFLIFILTATIG